MDKESDNVDAISQLLGKGECLVNEADKVLVQGVITAFDAIQVNSTSKFF